MFNLRTDKFIVLNNKLGKYVDSIRNNIDVLRDRHPDLFQELSEKMFIIDSDIDEAAKLVEEWESLDNDSRTFSMIINPTLGCNLRCWYCYEDHDNKPMMGKKVFKGGFGTFGVSDIDTYGSNMNCNCNCGCDSNGNCNCNCGGCVTNKSMCTTTQATRGAVSIFSTSGSMLF